MNHRAQLISAMLVVALVLCGGNIAAEPKLEKMAEGLVFPEGPVWHPDGFLLLSDVHDSKILRLKPEGGTEVWYDAGRKTNGLILGNDKKKIYAACHSHLELIEIDLKTTHTRVLAKEPLGKPLNNVNDVAVDPHGNVFFTDPKWGVKPGDVQGVYRWSPDGKCELAAAMELQPNGIVVSPDKKSVFVARTGGNDIWRFTLDNGKLKDGAQWAKLEEKAGPDGMTIDSKGNLYVAQAGNGKVSIVSPEGKSVQQIRIWDRMATNCEFEGGSEKILYVTGNGNNKTRQGEVCRVTLE